MIFLSFVEEKGSEWRVFVDPTTSWSFQKTSWHCWFPLISF